jgi:hypothetical protein
MSEPSPPREPSPEEAARALRELTRRRHQALRGRAPRPVWWGAGAVLVLQGVLEDLFPSNTWIGLAFIWVFVVLAYAVRWRPVGAALGYRASTRGRPPASVSAVSIGGLVAIAAVEFALHSLSHRFDLPWNHTISGLFVGLMLAFVLPWVIDLAFRQHEEHQRAQHGELGHHGS